MKLLVKYLLIIEDSFRDANKSMLMQTGGDEANAKFLFEAIMQNKKTDRATKSQTFAIYAIMSAQFGSDYSKRFVDSALKSYEKNMDAQLLKAYFEKDTKERLRLVDEAIAMNPACSDAYLIKSTIQLQSLRGLHLQQVLKQKLLDGVEQTLNQGWQNVDRPLSKLRVQDRMLMVAFQHAIPGAFAFTDEALTSQVPNMTSIMRSFRDATVEGMRAATMLLNVLYNNTLPLYYNLSAFPPLAFALPANKETAAQIAMAMYLFATPHYLSSKALFQKGSMFFQLPRHIMNASLSQLHYAILVMSGKVNMQQLLQLKTEKQVIAYLDEQFQQLDKDNNQNVTFQQDYDVSELCHAKLIEKL